MKVRSFRLFVISFALAMAMAAGDVAAADRGGSGSSGGGGEITVVPRRTRCQSQRSTPLQQRAMSKGMTEKANCPNTSNSNIMPVDAGTTAVTMIPRGGSGDIVVTPTLVAKVVTLLASAQGLMMKLAPVAALEQYGVTKDRASLPMTKFLATCFASGILSYAILAYGLLFTEQTSLQAAAQFAYIPWALWHLDNALNNAQPTKKDKTSTSIQNQQLSKNMVVVSALCMYTAGQNYGEKSLMVQAVIWGLCGVQMILAPMTAAKSWQVDMLKFDDQHCVSLSNVGWSMVAMWTFIASMIKFDATSIEAFGYGGIVWGTMHATNCLLGKNKKIGIDDIPSWIWAFINFGTSAYILSSSS